MDSCVLCGSTELTQQHHISYNPEIIAPLCKVCHEKEHKHGTGKSYPNNTKPRHKAITKSAGIMSYVKSGTVYFPKEFCNEVGLHKINDIACLFRGPNIVLVTRDKMSYEQILKSVESFQHSFEVSCNMEVT